MTGPAARPGPDPAPGPDPGYRPFEVVGLELEYPIVDRDLRVRPLVEAAFRRLHGRPTSDVVLGRAGLSNELAAHVLEIKTGEPERRLVEAERVLAGAVADVARLLAEAWDARLLPTGMHPFMRPEEGELWRRSGRRIYGTYDRVFGIRRHGWLNLQSCHVNLPFGDEAETVRLHDAIACLLPYLPALAASSPLIEGRLGPAVDNRLAVYATNQARIPAIAGDVVPEYMGSFRRYRREVLGRIYRELRKIPEARGLTREWVNSRGAIVRFSRRAIEIRVLDVQECVRMDVAIAAFVRGALVRLTGRMAAGEVVPPPHETLVADYRSAVADGTAARVAAPHLGPLAGARPGENLPAGELVAALAEDARAGLAPEERPYLDLVARRVDGGNLSERIRRRVEAAPARRREAGIRALYDELADHLADNRVWDG